MSEAAALLAIALLLSRKFDPGRLDPEVQWLVRLSSFQACQEGRFPPPEPAETLEILRQWAPALRPAELPFADQQELLPLLLQLGQARHPDATARHNATFANVANYGLTGWSGGYGGPSMREHWGSCLITREGEPGAIPFARVMEIAEQAAYGPFSVEMARMLAYEQCFDDPDGEQEQALLLLREAGENALLVDDDDFSFDAEYWPEDDI